MSKDLPLTSSVLPLINGAHRLMSGSLRQMSEDLPLMSNMFSLINGVHRLMSRSLWQMSKDLPLMSAALQLMSGPPYFLSETAGKRFPATDTVKAVVLPSPPARL